MSTGWENDNNSDMGETAIQPVPVKTADSSMSGVMIHFPTLYS